MSRDIKKGRVFFAMALIGIVVMGVGMVIINITIYDNGMDYLWLLIFLIGVSAIIIGMVGMGTSMAED